MPTKAVTQFLKMDRGNFSRLMKRQEFQDFMSNQGIAYVSHPDQKRLMGFVRKDRWSTAPGNNQAAGVDDFDVIPGGFSGNKHQALMEGRADYWDGENWVSLRPSRRHKNKKVDKSDPWGGGHFPDYDPSNY